MSVQQDTRILDEIVRRIVDGFHPERIYLFGSRARGDHHEDSDYDLMVLVQDSDPPSHERIVEAYRVLSDVGVPVEVLMWPADKFDRQLPVIASLPSAIIREGQLLYAS